MKKRPVKTVLEKNVEGLVESMDFVIKHMATKDDVRKIVREMTRPEFQAIREELRDIRTELKDIRHRLITKPPLYGEVLFSP